MEGGIKSTCLICLKSKRNIQTTMEVKIMASNHLLSADAYQHEENSILYASVTYDYQQAVQATSVSLGDK